MHHHKGLNTEKKKGKKNKKNKSYTPPPPNLNLTAKLLPAIDPHRSHFRAPDPVSEIRAQFPSAPGPPSTLDRLATLGPSAAWEKCFDGMDSCSRSWRGRGVLALDASVGSYVRKGWYQCAEVGAVELELELGVRMS